VLVINNNPTISTLSKLDLADNTMVIRNGSVAGTAAQIAAGFNGGVWNGTGGIASSTAAGSTITALGFASNKTLNTTAFAGVIGLSASAMFVKYTYYGDSDLSGATTLDDFTLFLNGYRSGGSTWIQGDLNFSGSATLDDFTLLVTGYRQQLAPL
jgi:hypothetical protein